MRHDHMTPAVRDLLLIFDILELIAKLAAHILQIVIAQNQHLTAFQHIQDAQPFIFLSPAEIS